MTSQLVGRRCLGVLPLLRSRQVVKHQEHKLFTTFRSSRVEITSEANLGSLLPPAYYCNETWQRRLDTPILKKLELDDFFYQVDKKYQMDKVISPIDVDLFVNKVTDDESLEELEEMIHRLRRSPSAADTLPSTSHAVVRILVHLDQTKMLFRILNDRMNYGVFLDFYTANLLMDKFLAVGNYKDAAKIASLLMLEEDFGPPTTKFFALLSCLKYLDNPTSEPWNDDALPEPDVEDSKDEVRVRVKYLRNPFFDDHFELRNPRHIIGKTLAYLSLQLTEDDILRNSFEIYGWALHDKWAKVESRLKELGLARKSISTEVVSKVKELADARISEVEASPDKKLPLPELKQVIGLNLDQSEIANAFQRLKWDEQTFHPLPVVKDLLAKAKFDTTNLPLLPAVTEHLSRAISECTQAEVEELKETYRQWEDIRMEELNKQLLKFKEIQLLLEHQQKKKELKEREDTIFFFDHEEEWMMKLASKETEGHSTGSSLLEATPGKQVKKQKKDDDSDYVSPIF